MADIAASDVTYTMMDEDKLENGDRLNVVKVVFGDGALTYPAGGVALTKADMGVATRIKAFNFVDAANANGLVYKFDYTNEKIRIYEVDTTGDTDKALVELDSGSDTPAAATLYVEVRGY